MVGNHLNSSEKSFVKFGPAHCSLAQSWLLTGGVVISLFTGNGKRAEMEELPGHEKKNAPGDEGLLPGYASDLRNLGELFRDRKDNDASKNVGDDSSDPYLRAAYEAEVRSEEREEERRLNALVS